MSPISFDFLLSLFFRLLETVGLFDGLLRWLVVSLRDDLGFGLFRHRLLWAESRDLRLILSSMSSLSCTDSLFTCALNSWPLPISGTFSLDLWILLTNKDLATSSVLIFCRVKTTSLCEGFEERNTAITWVRTFIQPSYVFQALNKCSS